METIQAFNPMYGEGQLVSVTGTAQQVNIDPTASNVRIANNSANVVFVRITDSRTASANQQAQVNVDLAVLPDTAVVVTKGQNQNVVSLIGAVAGPSSVYVQPGIGLWSN
jgi:hypothetical protein